MGWKTILIGSVLLKDDEEWKRGTAMASGDEKVRIWWGAVNAEKHALYYSHRANVMQVWSTVVSVLVLTASSSAIVSLVTTVLPELVSATLFASAGLATIADIKWGFTREATNSLWIKNECRNLAFQWETLWMRRNELPVMETCEGLEERLETITRNEIHVFKKWNARFEQEADHVVRKKFTPRESAPISTARAAAGATA